MTKVSAVGKTEEMDVEVAEASFQLSDAGSIAEVVLTEGLAFCAQKMGLGDHQSVVDRLREGDDSACRYCRYGLAKKVAESVGRLDDEVKAVYVFDYGATPQDLCFGQKTQVPLIHLIIWVEQKTDALDSLVAALDRALVRKYANLVDKPRLAHMLDVQVVDDADVENHVGYGALLSSIHNRPIQVWER